MFGLYIAAQKYECVMSILQVRKHSYAKFKERFKLIFSLEISLPWGKCFPSHVKCCRRNEIQNHKGCFKRQRRPKEPSRHNLHLFLSLCLVDKYNFSTVYTFSSLYFLRNQLTPDIYSSEEQQVTSPLFGTR